MNGRLAVNELIAEMRDRARAVIIEHENNAVDQAVETTTRVAMRIDQERKFWKRRAIELGADEGEWQAIVDAFEPADAGPWLRGEQS